jgi:hypothetical protein
VGERRRQHLLDAEVEDRLLVWREFVGALAQAADGLGHRQGSS